MIRFLNVAGAVHCPQGKLYRRRIGIPMLLSGQTDGRAIFNFNYQPFNHLIIFR
jgi:hypothetical protein